MKLKVVKYHVYVNYDGEVIDYDVFGQSSQRECRKWIKDNFNIRDKDILRCDRTTAEYEIDNPLTISEIMEIIEGKKVNVLDLNDIAPKTT